MMWPIPDTEDTLVAVAEYLWRFADQDLEGPNEEARLLGDVLLALESLKGVKK